MCVIFAAISSRLTAREVAEADETNRDGIGFAWRAGRRGVVWEKGVHPKRAKQLAASLPMPYLAHFRWATVGGVRPVFCHPFPIDTAALSLRGATQAGVLVHNGHSEGAVFNAQVAGLMTDPGEWTDTRVFARLVGLHQTNIPAFLNKLAGSFAVLTPTALHLARVTSVVRPGLVASNMMWQGGRRAWDQWGQWSDWDDYPSYYAGDFGTKRRVMSNDKLTGAQLSAHVAVCAGCTRCDAAVRNGPRLVPAPSDEQKDFDQWLQSHQVRGDWNE